MEHLTIISSGMINAVGMHAPAACAAIRCGINNFDETRFLDQGGEWIIGSMVPLKKPLRGKMKLLEYAVSVIKECLQPFENIPLNQIALLLCIAEKDRPGRLSRIDEELLEDIQEVIGSRFHKESKTISLGRVAGAYAISLAGQLLSYNDITHCLIVGVDTLLVAPTLEALEENDFLLTSNNSDGFIPGEAGAAVLVTTTDKTNQRTINILSAALTKEKANINSEEPLRAEGLVLAIKQALSNCGLAMHNLDFRMTDTNGKQYYFKEAALALTRILRERKEEFDIWHPADCIGEVGAAIVPSILAIALTAAKKGYLPGKKILCHIGNDSGERAAIILNAINNGGS